MSKAIEPEPAMSRQLSAVRERLFRYVEAEPVGTLVAAVLVAIAILGSVVSVAGSTGAALAGLVIAVVAIFLAAPGLRHALSASTVVAVILVSVATQGALLLVAKLIG